MIGFLKGIVEEILEDNVVVEVQGIGYNVKISAQTASSIPGIGSEVKLYTYTSVREDAIWLYGFLTRDELSLFKQIITVNGIGPKVGLGILSSMSVNELRLAILAQDVKKISKAPGIGAKTAERLILDLKDKVSMEEALGVIGQETIFQPTSKTSPNMAEAIEALSALGYSSTDSLKAVSSIEGAQDMSVEALLKAALKQMSFL